MNRFSRWMSPFILAVVVTAAIRLVTDMASSYPFWLRPMDTNLKDFLCTVVTAYLFDLALRYLVRSPFRQEKRWRVPVEYATLTVFLLVGITLSTLGTHYVIGCPNRLIDFIISYVVAAPILLFYYTMLRNGEVRQAFARQTLQLEKMKSEQLHAELNFLRAQYHPHFLFNALNTVYVQVDEQNTAARDAIEKLSDLLRYQLYDIRQEVRLDREIAFVQTYIDFQSLRMSKRLQLSTAMDSGTGSQRIHPLLFLPLLENAFKYVGGDYRIGVYLSAADGQVRFAVENTHIPAGCPSAKKAGIGLANLRRRLDILYPGRYRLIAAPRQDVFRAELILQLYEPS